VRGLFGDGVAEGVSATSGQQQGERKQRGKRESGAKTHRDLVAV